MIKIDDKVYRNLEEQVQKNKEDIARHYEIDRVLANFGIKIVGTVASVNDLPDPSTYPGEFGDAYAVGMPGNYIYYIYTRPNYNAGETENNWLDVGKLGIQGPQGNQGPQGEPGPQGEKGSTWYNGTSIPKGANLNKNDQWLNSLNGNVSEYNGQQWILKTNLTGPQGVPGIQGPQGVQGPQGPRGPKGDTGDVGGFINIFGKVNIPEQLPLPSELRNLTAAYLVGIAEPFDLYIQIGENSETATWNNVGPFNVATLITVNGIAQNVWDADTKLDKDSSVTLYDQVYVKAADGGQGTINVNEQIIANAVVQRQSDGNIYVPLTPVGNADATSRTYVDTNTFKKRSIEYSYVPSYNKDTGNQDNLQFSQDVTPNSLVQRKSTGAITAAEPAADNEVVTVSYANDEYVIKDKEKYEWLAGQMTLYGTQYDSAGMPTQTTAYVTGNPISGRIPRWSSSETLLSELPSIPNVLAPVLSLKEAVTVNAATKWYVKQVADTAFTPNQGTLDSRTNIKVTYNPYLKIAIIEGLISVTNTSDYTSTLSVTFDSATFQEMLGTCSQDFINSVNAMSYKYVQYPVLVTFKPTSGALTQEPEGGYIQITISSSRPELKAYLYESLDNHRAAGTRIFRINTTIAY